jgi:glucosamine-phosphate N-acetyltransferase
MNDLVRGATLEDLDSILELLNQLTSLKDGTIFNREKVENIYRKILDDENYSLCVYQDEGKILGTALLLVQMNISQGGRPYSHIENVVVDKGCRGKGAGKKMIDYLVDKAKGIDCYKILLNCGKDNITFYEKCGFFDSGEVEMRLAN